jgi:ribonuclease HII
MGRVRSIIGLDEVGRGSLAGPVTVGAVLLRPGVRLTAAAGLILRDSKKLSPRQREDWVRYVKKRGDIPYAVASVSAKRVDQLNVARAANLAAGQALKKLIRKYGIDLRRTAIYLDGGLFLPLNLDGFAQAKTIIKGDEKIPAVSLASIIAKVHRDRLMVAYHKHFPRYDFARHKGYGTRGHIHLVKKYGLSGLHRKTFCKFI